MGAVFLNCAGEDISQFSVQCKSAKMRWRWSSLCPLLLLLFKIAKSDDGEEEESGLEDGSGYNPADSTTINPTNASNEMGCEKAIATDFILDPFHDWIDGSACTSNEGCRALECCSMGNIERAAQAARFDTVEGEPKSVCRVKDVYIYVFFTLCLFVILGFIVCCGCIICIRRSAVATATDFKMRENPHNSRNVPSMLPPAPE